MLTVNKKMANSQKYPMPRVTRLLLGTALGVAASWVGLNVSVAQANPSQASAPPAVQALLADRPPTFPADGVYIFGQRPLPDQLETAYLVFESQAGSIVGAFYMPQSSFDCVQGRVQETQLSMSITDSYSYETYDYALGLNHDTMVASTGNVSVLNIEGFQQLDQVSDNDLRILNTCKAFYGAETGVEI
jgi:hypothetical protein